MTFIHSVYCSMPASNRSDLMKKAAVVAGGVLAVGGLSYLAYRQLYKDSPTSKTPSVVATPEKSEIEKLDINSISRDIKSLRHAKLLKEKGNSHFSKNEFHSAIECYSMAIDICPTDNRADMATFYQNRAAANDKLNLLEVVVSDCTEAINRNSHYPKAMVRRAKAQERLENYQQALLDITAVAMMERFSNANTLDMCDRVLQAVSQKKAKIELQRRNGELVPLSKSFVESYITSFCEDPVFSQLPPTTHNNMTNGNEHGGDSDFDRLLHELSDKEYDLALDTCTELLSMQQYAKRTAVDNEQWMDTAKLLLVQCTFGIIRGDKQNAWDQLKQLFDLLDTAPKEDPFAKKARINGYIKRGSFYMQQGDKDKAFEEFDRAIQVDPINADIYHHRGQLYVLINQTRKAKADFEMCAHMRPEFGVARAQGAYADYRDAQQGNCTLQANKAINMMENMCNEFPFCSEAFALLGQVYAEKNNFDDALEQFQKALELNPTNANLHVHMA